MTIKEILDFGRQKLTQAGIEYPGLEAEILLCRILDQDRIYFYTHSQEMVDSERIEKLSHRHQETLSIRTGRLYSRKKRIYGDGFFCQWECFNSPTRYRTNGGVST